MNNVRPIIRVVTLIVFTLALSAVAQAQATRTWVSGVGDDVNPCSRTAPCKTFAGAISKTAVGGEINALDPGGYGTITITKHMTIDGGGTFASILASGTTGVIVNDSATGTPNTINVTVRNLSINGTRHSTSAGVTGVRYISGATLNVENCNIQNFTAFGIQMEPSVGGFLFVKDTTITNVVGTGGGIAVAATTSGISRATIDNVRVQNSTFGIKAGANSRVNVRNSSLGGNDNGLLADGSTAVMNVEDSGAVVNSSGIRSRNSAVVRISNVNVFSNVGPGLVTETGGQIISFGQNRIANNSPDGAPTSSVLQQ